MALSNQTLEQINYIKDIEIDWNIKIYIILLLSIFFVAALIINREMKADTFYKVILKMTMMIYMFSYILTIVWSPIMLFREYSAIEMWTVVIVFWGISFLLFALVATIWGWTKILDIFGFDSDLINNNSTFKEERKNG